MKFFQRKKGKKESFPSSGGFKEVKFFYKKILPDSSLEFGVWSFNQNLLWKILGGDFFIKTGGLNFTFLKLELTFTFLFYFSYDRDISIEDRSKMLMGLRNVLGKGIDF